ncbi:MAG: dTDP-4-amino-4,6-dideoxygalactose transaminase [Ignavibacteria bacterium]|nr:dTDP-4-amino-4,6-dideoxygalactose transaminase [Ignavibacteria bacterium]
MKYPFNKPFLTGKEIEYIVQAVESGKISGDGRFTKLCHSFFEERFGFRKVMLTTSCSDALEMCAILLDFKPGDEVIIPSFTFVSTANAFALRGAKIVFADSGKGDPNIDPALIESLITPATKAIVLVHYAGIACDMDAIMDIATRHKLHVVEDAAHSIDSYYKGKPLGSFGSLAAFSFHETKNVISGEGGMLVINDEQFIKRAEIIREKGTNRSSFFRGEVDKYNWVDIGSSFLPSEIIAAFLYAQLENLDKIQKRRISLWEQYYEGLKEIADKGFITLPVIPQYATNNGHMFYILCRSQQERQELIDFMKAADILPTFHYLSLHKSPFFEGKHDGRELVNSDSYTDRLLRMPLYYELPDEGVKFITEKMKEFYDSRK